jgi:hypothetical protein
MGSKLSKIIADFSTTLTTKLSIGGTTASILAITDDDVIALPSGNYWMCKHRFNFKYVICKKI